MATTYENVLEKFYDANGDLHILYPKTKAEQVIGIENYDQVISDTTSNWNSQRTLVSKKNIIYVYTDHLSKTVDGKTVYIPGVKIGDGKAYLIDLPFTDTITMDHINNSGIHVTQNEKNFWNNKIRCYMDSVSGTRLIFTTE